MGRREDNKRVKRERLESEGLALFLASGYDRTSIEQIAAASGVARGTFYLYFPDKLALFETVVDRWFTLVFDLLDEVDQRLCRATDRAQSYAIYQEMATGLALTALAHNDEILLAFREARQVGEAGERLRQREERMLDAVTTLTRHAAERGLITTDEPRLATFIIYGAVERLFYEFMIGNPLGDPADVAREVVRMFGRSLELPVG